MSRLIVDVREPYEFASGHVKGAVNIPPADIIAGAPQLQNISKNTELILYCHSGSRSRAAEQYLRAMGFTNVVNGINKDHVARNYGV